MLWPSNSGLLVSLITGSLSVLLLLVFSQPLSAGANLESLPILQLSAHRDLLSSATAKFQLQPVSAVRITLAAM